MGYIVDYDELRSIEKKASSKCAEWSTALEEIFTKVKAVKDSEAIEGEMADSLKSYLNEVHVSVLSGIGMVIGDYTSKFFLYRDGYRKDIDTGHHAHIREEDLGNVKRRMLDTCGDIDNVNAKLTTAFSPISDLISLSTPSSEALDDALEEVRTLCNNLDTNIAEYETYHKEHDFVDMEAIITNLQTLIDNQMSSKRVSIRDYKPGLVNTMTDFKTLVASVQSVQEFQKSMEGELAEALEREKQMQVELEEERQWAKWLATGITVVGSITLIAFTAGGAAPLLCMGIGAAAGGVSVASNKFADNYVETGSFVEGMDWVEFSKECVVGTVTGAISGYGGAIAYGSSVVKPMERVLVETTTGIMKNSSEGIIRTTFDVGAGIIKGDSFDKVMSAAYDNTENMLKDITIGMVSDTASGYVGGLFDARYADKNFGQELFSETMENLAEKEVKIGTSVTWNVGMGFLTGKDGMEIINSVEMDTREHVQAFVKDEFSSAVSSSIDTAIDDGFKGNDTTGGKTAQFGLKTANKAVSSTIGGFTSGMTGQVMKGESINAGQIWKEDLGGGTKIFEDSAEGLGKDVVNEVYSDKKFENKLKQHDYDRDGKVEVVTFKNFSGYSVLKEDYDAAREVAGGAGYERKRAQDILGLSRNVSFKDDNVEVHRYDISSLKKSDYSGKGSTNAIKVEHK